MKRPESVGSLRHVALRVSDLEACERFYCELLGMRVEWRPDPDNLYLTSGNDNLALHRNSRLELPDSIERLDHIGFILKEPDQVDQWCEFLRSNAVPILKEPRSHRDGARSFYCQDPDGNTVQMIFHPPISKK